ncbi:MAG TPA: glycosyltransferase family 1 protein [Bacteroidetes bacterium]|nr:glycosyltransferase family 1 protein [Bacteroidota bacterium]
MGRMVDVSSFMGFHISDYDLGASRQHCKRFFAQRIPFIPHTLTLRLKTNAFLLNRFAESNKYDIYHQTYFYDVLRRWNGKRVVTVYDMIYELYPQDYEPDDPTARNKAEAVRRADFVICISEQTRRDVVDILRIPKEKTGVVYLSNSLTLTVTMPRVIDSPYLLYVGKRGGYKNFGSVVKAFAQTPSLRDRFQLICFGGGEFTQHELETFAGLRLDNKCRQIAGSDEVLANLYQHAAAFVYPSTYEGFGIPPLEAMHYGCPVVASNASSIPEVVGGAGIYFTPSSVDDIADRLESAVSDSALRSSIIEHGYAREKLFSWDRCAHETLAIYEQLV